jgi:hypothetical protein
MLKTKDFHTLKSTFLCQEWAGLESFSIFILIRFDVLCIPYNACLPSKSESFSCRDESLLREPFAKAVHILFLVSEVHSFNEGNGRIADYSVMTNAESSEKGMPKIIIQSVYR